MDTALTLAYCSIFEIGFEYVGSPFIRTSIIVQEMTDSTQSIATDTMTSAKFLYELNEMEWIRIIGKERFFSLDKKSRDFLIKTAGVLDFGGDFDIEKAYRTSPYE